MSPYTGWINIAPANGRAAHEPWTKQEKGDRPEFEEKRCAPGEKFLNPPRYPKREYLNRDQWPRDPSRDEKGAEKTGP